MSPPVFFRIILCQHIRFLEGMQASSTNSSFLGIALLLCVDQSVRRVCLLAPLHVDARALHYYIPALDHGLHHERWSTRTGAKQYVVSKC